MNNANYNFKPKRQISRRDFLKLLQTAVPEILLLASGSAWYASIIEPAWVEVAELHLKLSHLAKSFDGFKLAQISDIHIGGSITIDIVEGVVNRLISLNPDVVVITGDFVWGYLPSSEPDLHDLGVELTRLCQFAPVFAVLGNHDHWLDVDAIRRMLNEAGIKELANNIHTLTRGSDQLHICGVNDIYEKLDDLGAVLGKLPGEGCAILLAHEPDFADKSALTGRFDLQLSGHSHGGQIILPGFGPLLLPHLAKKYPVGLYKVGEMFQYTNRGLGMGGIRVRFNCRPEITVFTLDGLADQ